MLNTRIVTIQGMQHRVGLIPTTVDEALGMPSFHRLMKAELAPAQCINSVNDPFFDTGGNAPNDSDDNTYTGDPVGDCGVNMVANIIAVLSSRYGGTLGRIYAKAIVAFYLQYTNGEDSGVNIPEFLAYCMSTPMVDSTGKAWPLAPASGLTISNQAAVQQCIASSDYGAVSSGIISSYFEQASNSAQPGAACVVSRLRRGGGQPDHAVGAIDYGEAGAPAAARKLNYDTNAINAATFSVGYDSWGLYFIVDFESLPTLAIENFATGLKAGLVAPPNTPSPTPTPKPPPARPIIERLQTRWDGDSGLYLPDSDAIEAVIFGD